MLVFEDLSPAQDDWEKVTATLSLARLVFCNQSSTALLHYSNSADILSDVLISC